MRRSAPVIVLGAVLAILLGAGNAAAETVVKWLHLELDPGYVALRPRRS